MKNTVRALSLMFLMLGLICYGIPQDALAEQLNALGQLVTKGSVAYIDNSPIPSGTTVIAGDKIRALNAPALISLTNGGRLELTPNTVLSVSGEGQALQVTQTSGKSRFYVPKQVTLTLVTPKGTVKTVSAQQAYSGVLAVENNRMVFTSETGEFAVTDAAAEKTTNVQDGQSTSVPQASGPSSADKGRGTPSGPSSSKSGGGSGTNTAAWWAAGVAIAGGATALAITATSGSDTVPVASPSRP